MYTDADIEMAQATESANNMAAIARQLGTRYDTTNPDHKAHLQTAAGWSIDSWGSVVEATIETLYEQWEIVGDLSDGDFSNDLFDALERAI